MVSKVVSRCSQQAVTDHLNSAAIGLLTGVYVIAQHLDFDGRRAFRS